MNNYVIFTDAACDISADKLKAWGVLCVSMTFRFDNDKNEYTNDDMDIKTFYGKMRDGNVAKTAAINADVFMSAFENVLAQGTDVLYIGFSSGLSSTYNSARLASLELQNKYPDRKMIMVDSLSGSAGLGLLLYLTLEQKNAGASIEQAAEYAENIKLKICHWFTVDDLVYLKRGGRISPTVAFVGNALGIKPVLYVDENGKLVKQDKARGRKNALNVLADKYGELCDGAVKTVYISHSDCENDAKELEQIMQSRYDVKVDMITDIGSILGAHAGPGTVALFFVGKER